MPDAQRLKDHILKAVKGQDNAITVDTWKYIKSGDDFDIIFHDVPQYVQNVSKNVVFRVGVDGMNVVFSTAWWAANPVPAREMFCLHTGRLIEMLLNHFSDCIVKFTIADY